MILNSNSRQVMFKELSGDQYGLKNIPQDSISTFIDIGAAYGLVSILARLLHTKMRIIALEPHNTTCAYLSHNVSNMGIVTFNAAYGTGETFYLKKERKMLLCNHFGHKPTACQSIRSVTLAKLASLFKFNLSSLAIKMDTEGAEWYIFDNGDLDIIKRCKLAAFEVHDNGDGNTVDMFYKKINNKMKDTHKVSVQYSSKTLAIVKATTF